MTKNRLLAIAAFLAVHSGIIAGNVLITGKISPFSVSGFYSTLPHIVTFFGFSLFALTVKQKFWQIGGILAALSALSLSCISGYPDQKVTFGIITIIVSSASIAALVASWRLETFDLSWWNRNRGGSSYKPAFVLLIAIAIVAIFIYWGRG